MHWVHIFVFPGGNSIEVHNVNIFPLKERT